MKSRNDPNAKTTITRVVVLASMLLAVATHAQGAGRRLMLSVYLDTVGAGNVLAGNAASAINTLGSRGARPLDVR